MQGSLHDLSQTALPQPPSGLARTGAVHLAAEILSRLPVPTSMELLAGRPPGAQVLLPQREPPPSKLPGWTAGGSSSSSGSKTRSRFYQGVTAPAVLCTLRFYRRSCGQRWRGRTVVYNFPPGLELDTSIDIPDRPEKRMVKELSRYEDPDDPIRPQAPPRDRKGLWAPPGPQAIAAPEVLVVGLGRRLRADEEDGPRARLGAGAVEALQRRYQVRTHFDADVQGYMATCRASLDKSGRAGVQKIHLVQPLVAHDTDVAHALEKLTSRPRMDQALCFLNGMCNNTVSRRNAEATTKLPSDVSIGKLLTWARKQEFMKVHPVLSARASQLSVSVPVEAGTPLLGVLEDGFLFEPEPSDGEGPWQHLYQVARKQHPDWWALHLAIPLLRQSFSAPSTSPIWQAHLQSIPLRPAAPHLWSLEQANELQYVEIKAALKTRIEALQAFHRDHISPEAGSAPSVLELGRAVAVAASRGMEVKPGRRALIPVLDLIGPPEATTCAGEDAPEPSCRFAVEPSGGLEIPLP
eukprot:s6421_g2.t1